MKLYDSQMSAKLQRLIFHEKRYMKKKKKILVIAIQESNIAVGYFALNVCNFYTRVECKI